jgi:hypothetical protein
MSSMTKQTDAKRRARLYKAGRRRKNLLGKKSTLSKAELFEGFGEPGKKTPKQD